MKTKTAEKEGVRLRAQELGADLVGVLNLADYKSSRSPDPRKYLTGARSVIVLGFRVLSGAYDNDSWTRMHSYLYSGEVAGNMAAYSLAQELEDNYGARTLIIHPHRPFDLTEETYRMPIGSLSLRHAAVQSGIAVFGKNTLALTPRFGPRLFFFGNGARLCPAIDPPRGSRPGHCRGKRIALGGDLRRIQFPPGRG